MRHERLAIVLANVTVRLDPGLAPEITGELAALIIFNHDNHLTPIQNATDFRSVQRHNPFNSELIDHDAFFACEFFHRFPDCARGRAQPTSVTSACSGPTSFGGAMSLIAPWILRARLST